VTWVEPWILELCANSVARAFQRFTVPLPGGFLPRQPASEGPFGALFGCSFDLGFDFFTFPTSRHGMSVTQFQPDWGDPWLGR